MPKISLPRALKIDISGHNAFFLWGPRKVGKTTFLKSCFPQANYIDLLDRSIEMYYVLHPGALIEQAKAKEATLFIIDEIQKLPPC